MADVCLCSRDQDGVCRPCRAMANRYARHMQTQLRRTASAEERILSKLAGWCIPCQRRDLDRAFADILREARRLGGPAAAEASYMAFAEYMRRLGIGAHPLMDAVVKPATAG